MRKPRNESKFKQNIRNFLLTNPLMTYKTISGHLLTHDAAKVLVCCIYDVDDSHYFGYEIRTNFIDSYLGKSMNHAEIFSALRYLEKIGLVENLHGNQDNYTFSATHEGMHFFELRRRNYIYLLSNSILLPIIISILTTIVTLLITAS